MTAETVAMILGPELARKTQGFDRKDFAELRDDLLSAAERIQHLMACVDNGEMYLPGLEPSVARYPNGEWGRN